MPRPRRQIPRATGGQGQTLDPATEWELSVWGGLRIDGMGLNSLEEVRAAWADHAAAILPAWIAQMPGSRPFGCYVTGEIPLPPIVDKPYPHDEGRQIGTTAYHDSRCYGIGDVDELEHLVAHGIVDADEEHAARLRIDEHGTRILYSWQHTTEH